MDLLNLIGLITGILGVYFSIKEKLIAWPTFIICYVTYFIVGLYDEAFAFSILNLVFIFISINGWYNWSKLPINNVRCPKISIKKTLKKTWYINLCIWIIGSIVISAWLRSIIDEPSIFWTYLEAFAFCVAFSAQWMLGKKLIGTWICWLISDIAFMNYFYYHKENLLLTLLYFVFIIMASCGWLKWHKELKSKVVNA